MRPVKLGRTYTILPTPLAHHWAVKVGDTWYEVRGGKRNSNYISRSSGSYAESGAGYFGGELVGETNKTDSQIDVWIENWCRKYPNYDVFSANCQKFAYEFMHWLTNGNFVLPHRFNAAEVLDNVGKVDGFAVADDGNAIAKWGTHEVRKNVGFVGSSFRSFHFQGQAVAGPGLGAWAEASGAKLELSYGNVVGLHLEPNINTGIGIRNGNVDVHLLGFGAKVGADGLEVNTPIGGANLCSIM